MELATGIQIPGFAALCAGRRSLRLFFGRQPEERDLGGNKKAVRRPPVAGSGIHVDPHLSMTREPPVVPVEKRDKQIEWKELASVGMAGELKIKSQGLRGAGDAEALGFDLQLS